MITPLTGRRVAESVTVPFTVTDCPLANDSALMVSAAMSARQRKETKCSDAGEANVFAN
jgi:hypothetical protein